jgi:hypothetical protein
MSYSAVGRWRTVAALAAVTCGCVARKTVEGTPPTTTPAPQAPASAPPASPSPTGCPPPTIALDRPREGQRLTSSPVQVQADASPGVVHVEYFYHFHGRGLAPSADPPVFIGGSSVPPFRIDWNLPQVCTGVTLVGVGVDLCGNGTDTGGIHVQVCP